MISVILPNHFGGDDGVLYIFAVCGVEEASQHHSPKDAAVVVPNVNHELANIVVKRLHGQGKTFRQPFK